MTADQILSLGPALADYLAEFDDCFGRCEPSQHLNHYVRGQLSNLPRKSVEPIALLNNLAPRTLQEFLSSDVWDHAKLRDHVQQIVARDHADLQAIGVIDDSGHPKKGNKTAGVQWQYCGRSGKTDNCVVTVHLSYSSFDTTFRTMLDSDLFLPESWDQDRRRCQQAGIPDSVVYRPKYDIALEQLDRARANGIQFGWINADIWYSQKPKFLAGLEERQCRYVVEIPRNLQGWLYDPGANPRHPARSVEELCQNAKPMKKQEWVPFHIKDTNKGPMVWKAKAAPFWLQRGDQVLGPYWLITAYDPLHPEEEKLFLSNASQDTRLETILHVAFARWPVERCLEDKKSELGLSHFEVRKYQALIRHLLITLVSHLFLARQTQRLRGEKPSHHDLPGPRSSECPDRHASFSFSGARPLPSTNRAKSRLHTATQSTGTDFSFQNPPPPTPRTGALHESHAFL
jgi:SRSO17 transposase